MIRTATKEDVFEIILMSIADGGWQTNPSFSWLKPNMKKTVTFLTYLVTKENPMVFVYCDEKGNIVGFIAGNISAHFLGDNLVATDYALYIRSDFRHKRVGYKLLMYFLEMAKFYGAERIETMVPLNNFNRDSMKSLLNRRGFNLTSETYTLEFNNE